MKWIRAHYFGRRFFMILALVVLSFVAAFFYPALLFPAKMVFVSLVIATVADMAMLFLVSGIEARRVAPEKLSNGDENRIDIRVENWYAFPVSVEIIDELPFQFQKRDFTIPGSIPSGGTQEHSYTVRPVERGEYFFGALNVFASSPLRLAVRRFRFSGEIMVPVYPSIIQMRKYDLFAVSNRLVEAGIKKIRRIGASMEFDQIRRYITGDDYRKINWKATARKSELMVNQFRDERSQHVYSVIDMGRAMKMPFNAMTLLDYAINASLVISNVAIRREDRAGIITFSDKIEAILPASREYAQMFRILELLYKCRTGFLESNYEQLYAEISRKLNRRCLLLLYTNFETLSSLRRHLPLLAMTAKRHVLVVIFFLNTELDWFIETPAESIEEMYIKTIAEKFAFEKKQIVKELDRHGIHSILTSPELLTVNTINTYLELKSRGLI
ncbi:MAG: cell division protein FtsB [Spirochaetes bacterium RBG_13_51_14]|nr:MAG: cell division protein FtsB [Spirochaetes bacterium RBG_13_51_14]